MNTQDMMDLALELAGIDETPEDSGVVVPCEEIRRVMIGVDIDTADLLLAERLGVDLVIGHHPVTGSPAVNMYRVMERQIELMTGAGVPINKAQKVLRERMGSVERGSHPRNYDRVGSAARLLGMPLMNIHLPLDIVTETVVQAHLDEKLTQESTLQDVVDALKDIPEYDGEPAGPRIRYGSEGDYAGKVFVSMAGGTNGGSAVMKAYFEAGIGTLVLMHIPEDVLKAVRDQGIGNILVAGHMRSDSVGINRFIAALEERDIDVISMGGIIRP